MSQRWWLAPLFCALLGGGTARGAANLELAQAALARTSAEVVYDGAYRSIAYPGGDVPSHIGVCTDVVVRAYRTLGVDLQVLVHEDMRGNFDAYPRLWGLNRPDTNIDHRRVPNLETFFARNGHAMTPTRNADSYLPGDVVSWRLGGSLPHIGIVSHRRNPATDRPYIIHNVGEGPKEEDVLFQYQLHGHFRYPAPADSP